MTTIENRSPNMCLFFSLRDISYMFDTLSTFDCKLFSKWCEMLTLLKIDEVYS